MAGVRITVQDPTHGCRKLIRVFTYTSGGFGLSVPYHEAREGWLLKAPVDYSRQGPQDTHISETESYTASDQVKLSFHPDGFVQFSASDKGRILSGRDDEGNPKGLGIVINPLGTPLATEGPMFGIMAWGIADFDATDSAMFEDDDFYYRNCTRSSWNAYLIEGFVLPRQPALRRATIKGGRRVLPTRFQTKVWNRSEGGVILPGRTDLWEGPHSSIFDLRIVELAEQDIVLGLLPVRTTVGFDSDSGFELAGPSDMSHALMAVYPKPDWDATDFKSLDWQDPQDS